jgi:hypothetical protein
MGGMLSFFRNTISEIYRERRLSKIAAIFSIFGVFLLIFDLGFTHIGVHCKGYITVILDKKQHPEQSYKSCLGILHMAKKQETCAWIMPVRELLITGHTITILLIASLKKAGIILKKTSKRK